MDQTTAGGAPAHKGPSSAQGSRSTESEAGRVKVAVAVGGLFALSAVGASAAFVAEEMAPVAEPPVASVALPPAGGVGLPQPPVTSTGLTPPSVSNLVGEIPGGPPASGVRTGAVPVQNVAPATTPPTGLRLGSIAVPVPVRVLGAAPTSVPASPAQPAAPVGAGTQPTTSLPTVTVSLFAAGLNEATKTTVPDRAAVPMVVDGRAHGSPFRTGTSVVLPGQVASPTSAASWHSVAASPGVVAAAVTESKVTAPEAPGPKAAGTKAAGPEAPGREAPGTKAASGDAAGPAGPSGDTGRPDRDVRPAGANQASMWGAAVTRPGPSVGPAHGRDHGDGPSH